MNPLDSCRIREPICPLTEAMYHLSLVLDPQETSAAVAETETAVHPIAAAQHHREERGLNHFRTPESEELSEEAERLNCRWWDLEQESRSYPHNLAASRHTISSE